MLLTNGGSTIQAKFLAGTLSETTRRHGQFPRLLYANARAFGQRTSWPVGYQSVQRAVVPALQESGQVAALFGLDASLAAFVGGFGNLSAELSVDVTASNAANVLSNTAAAFAVDADLTGFLRARGAMAANFDLIARPAASDIAQEVWNSLKLEGDLSAGDLLRLMAAALAGKVSGASTGTVTIRDLRDTRNRIVATVDGNGNRTALTLNPGG